MSGSDNRTSREEAGATGLALLLDGGVAEAMASVEAMLANAQNAAVRAFAGLTRVQAAGAAAAAVASVPTPARSTSPQSEMHATAAANDQPAERLVPPPAISLAGMEQVAGFAPASPPGGGSPPPDRPTDSVPPSAAPAMAASEPIAPIPQLRAAPVMFASFAPPALPALGVQASVAAVEPQWDSNRPSTGAGAQASALGPSAPAAPVAGGLAGAEPSRTYAPPASQGTGDGRPAGGDVFLDGARVGTWLADHLAHEAGRPQTGGTGFDPRLTPAWPGTLQGG